MRYRLNIARRNLLCLIHRHDWEYFVDWSIGRKCRRCNEVEYDLPTARGPQVIESSPGFSGSESILSADEDGWPETDYHNTPREMYR